MNCWRHAVIVFFVSWMNVPAALPNTHPTKKVAEAKAASEARLAQLEIDLAAAEKELAEFELKLKGFRWPCGTEVMDFSKRLREARDRLKEMESKKTASADLEAVKAEIAGYEEYFRELNEKVDTIHVEKAPYKLNELRRKIVDLRARRDLLIHETQEVQTEEERRSVMEHRVVAIDQEIKKLQLTLEIEFKSAPPLLKGCGNDVTMLRERMSAAFDEFEALQAKNAEASELNKVQTEIAEYGRVIDEMSVQHRRLEEYHRGVAGLQRQLLELRVERGKVVLDLKSMWR